MAALQTIRSKGALLVGVLGLALFAFIAEEFVRAFGILDGMDFEIMGYIRRMWQQHPKARIFVTGGNGYRFAQEAEVDRNDALVEIGLNCILQYQNR
jgi:hypothetical protein